MAAGRTVTEGERHYLKLGLVIAVFANMAVYSLYDLLFLFPTFDLRLRATAETFVVILTLGLIYLIIHRDMM
jgi:uncharacterized membrane protein YqjE